MRRKNKYKAKKTVVDGITFDSKKESIRYKQLQLLERAGKIHKLELQPVFPVIVNDVKVCAYKADFGYWENGEKIIEDVKSPITRKNPVYRLKKKLVEALYRQQITEI